MMLTFGLENKEGPTSTTPGLSSVILRTWEWAFT